MNLQPNIYFGRLDFFKFFRYVHSFDNPEALGRDIIALSEALMTGDGSHPFAAELLQEALAFYNKKSAAGKKGMSNRWKNGGRPAEPAPEKTENPKQSKPKAPPPDPRIKRGKYANVPLSDSDLDKLRAEIPDVDVCIEELSEYMASHGKKYSDYVATLRNWNRRRAEFSNNNNRGATSFKDAERQRAASIARAAFPDVMDKYGL